MRVLLWVDEGYEGIPGGHRVQMDRTAAALRQRGIDVEIGVGPDVSLAGVDMVHAMGATPRTSIRRARRARIPVVTSTVYWSKAYVLGTPPQLSAVGRARRLVGLAAAVRRHGAGPAAEELVGGIAERRLTFESADLLLPNSQAEADAISTELGVTTPSHVVPNGADPATFTPPPSGAKREGVLYVGRIEPHKNQLGLLKALKGSGVRVTIVGPPHPHHPAYLRACRRAADDNVVFLSGREQGALAELYQGAAVHAMPSWFETTGLTSLEAALCLTPVVSTASGYVREYFGDLVEYCDPADPRSIRRAVEAAMSAPAPEALRLRVLDHYTWDHAASATIDAYRAVTSAGT